MSQKEIKSPAGPPPSSSRWYRHVAHTHTHTPRYMHTWTHATVDAFRSFRPAMGTKPGPAATVALSSPCFYRRPFLHTRSPRAPLPPPQGGRQRRGTCARPRRFSGVSSRQASSDRRRRRRSGRPRPQRRETRVTAPPARVAGLPRGKGSVARLAWTAPDASGFPSASSPWSECCELHSALSSSSAPFIILRPVVFWCFSAHFPPSWSG